MIAVDPTLARGSPVYAYTFVQHITCAVRAVYDDGDSIKSVYTRDDLFRPKPTAQLSVVIEFACCLF